MVDPESSRAGDGGVRRLAGRRDNGRASMDAAVDDPSARRDDGMLQRAPPAGAFRPTRQTREGGLHANTKRNESSIPTKVTNCLRQGKARQGKASHGMAWEYQTGYKLTSPSRPVEYIPHVSTEVQAGQAPRDPPWRARRPPSRAPGAPGTPPSGPTEPGTCQPPLPNCHVVCTRPSLVFPSTSPHSSSSRPNFLRPTPSPSPTLTAVQLRLQCSLRHPIRHQH